MLCYVMLVYSRSEVNPSEGARRLIRRPHLLQHLHPPPSIRRSTAHSGLHHPVPVVRPRQLPHGVVASHQPRQQLQGRLQRLQLLVAAVARLKRGAAAACTAVCQAVEAQGGACGGVRGGEGTEERVDDLGLGGAVGGRRGDGVVRGSETEARERGAGQLLCDISQQANICAKPNTHVRKDNRKILI